MTRACRSSSIGKTAVSLARVRRSLRGWGSRPHTSHANPEVPAPGVVWSIPEACPITVARWCQADEDSESTEVVPEAHRLSGLLSCGGWVQLWVCWSHPAG